MKKFVYLIFFSFNFLPGFFSQNWQWAKNISFTYTNPGGTCLASDNYANVYLSTNFVSGGTCLAKFNSQGNEIWRQYLTNTSGGSTIKGITSASNYIYITGGFSGTLQIGTSNLISNGWQDIFIACYDSNGNFVWANNYGGPTDDCGNGICSDVNGNIYLTGSYSDTANFGTSNLICQCSSTVYGSSNMFMAKINSFGNILLLKSSGSQNTTASGSSGTKIKTDISGNIFITGFFSDMTLDTFHIVGLGYFICKLDSLGLTHWVKWAGDPYHPYFNLDPDQQGNIILTGAQLQNHGGCRSTTKKYTSSGLLAWDVALGGNYYDAWMPNDIVTNGSNSFIVGSSWIDNIQKHYLLVAEYDSLGAVIAIDTTNSNAAGENIIRDSNGDFIVSGLMTGPLKLGNDSLSAPTKEVFIAKFKGSSFTGITNNNYYGIDNKIYPNPSSGIFSVGLRNKNITAKICVYDVLGNCVWNKDYQNDPTPEIDLSGQAKGIYFVELMSESHRTFKKIVID